LDIDVVDRQHDSGGPLEEALLHGITNRADDVAGVLSHPDTETEGLVVGNSNLHGFEEAGYSLDGFGTQGALLRGELKACLDVILEETG
jgi:hypothetical protein